MSYTIKSIFKQAVKSRDKIYVVSDGNNVVYVGKAGSQSVAYRMAMHIADVATNKKNPSAFSRLLLDNHPHYFEWKVQVLSVIEVQNITKSKKCCLRCAERALYDFYTKKYILTGNVNKPPNCCKK